MTQRIPENFSGAEWRLITIMGNTMPPRDPNDDDDDDEDEENDTEPDDIANRRSSENPTKMNKSEGSRNSSPGLISVRLGDWLR